MQRVGIDLEDSFSWGGGVLISTSDFPTNGAALSRTKKRVKRGYQRISFKNQNIYSDLLTIKLGMI